MLQFSTIR